MTQTSWFSRSCSALLASGALMIPLLASCGGGGGGNGGGGGSNAPRVSNAATPVPTSSNSTCGGRTFTPNYAGSVSLLSWDRFALRVYFTENDQLTDVRRAVAVAGFNQWVDATGGRSDYRIVGRDDKPQIEVTFFRFTGGTGDKLGESSVSYDSSDTIRSSTIKIGITGDNAEDISTAAHEYGHTLGITGHSPSNLDLMFFSGNRSGDITTPDLNTLLTAYCDNFNRASNRTKAAVGPLRTIVMHCVRDEHAH